jgi:lysyl-tRNA synthetase class 2
MADLVEGMICHLAETFCGGLLIKRSRAVEFRVPLLRINMVLRNMVSDNIAQLEADEFLANLYKWELDLDRDNAATTAKDIVSKIEVLKGLISTTASSEYLSRLDQSKSDFEALSADAFINLARPWRRVRYTDLLKGVDPKWYEYTPEQRKARAKELGVEIGPNFEDYEVTQHVFERLVEAPQFDPLYVTHCPKELVPLAKQNAQDDSIVDVYELIINGQEISPGYSELNDPIVQRERLEHQAGEETQKIDEEFILALEHGMPPAGGIGIGIDRLIMMLTGAEGIRDVVLFPQLKKKA